MNCRTREVVNLVEQTLLELSNRVENRDGRISVGTAPCIWQPESEFFEDYLEGG